MRADFTEGYGEIAGVLLRVLCHRADHSASKYLKSTLELPKPRLAARSGETLGQKMARLASKSGR